jgi:hypothetical protein
MHSHGHAQVWIIWIPECDYYPDIRLSPMLSTGIYNKLLRNIFNFLTLGVDIIFSILAPVCVHRSLRNRATTHGMYGVISVSQLHHPD